MGVFSIIFWVLVFGFVGLSSAVTLSLLLLFSDVGVDIESDDVLPENAFTFLPCDERMTNADTDDDDEDDIIKDAAVTPNRVDSHAFAPINFIFLMINSDVDIEYCSTRFYNSLMNWYFFYVCSSLS